MTRKLGADPALERLCAEAESGRQQPGADTERQAQLALQQAADQDEAFARELAQLVDQLEAARSKPPGSVANTISGGTQQGPVVMGRDFSNLNLTVGKDDGHSERR